MLSRLDKERFDAAYEELSHGSQQAIARLVRTLVTCEGLVIPSVESVGSASGKAEAKVPGDADMAHTLNAVDKALRDARRELKKAHRKATYLIHHAARTCERAEVRRGGSIGQPFHASRRGPYRRK